MQGFREIYMMLDDHGMNHIHSLIEQGTITEVTMKNPFLVLDTLAATIEKPGVVSFLGWWFHI